MHGTWSSEHDRLVIAGPIDDVAAHHHPAVQVTVGLDGPVTVAAADGSLFAGWIAVISSGARHALGRGQATTALSVYLGPESRSGTLINSLPAVAGGLQGVWTSPRSELADSVVDALETGGLHDAADRAISALADILIPDVKSGPSVHPRLVRALELLRTAAPDEIKLDALANAVGLSPDYLGRLFKRHTGVAFSVTARWMRLLAGLSHAAAGESLTDAAHLSGFADGAHANRVCWELGGAAPSTFLRAFGRTRVDGGPRAVP